MTELAVHGSLVVLVPYLAALYVAGHARENAQKAFSGCRKWIVQTGQPCAVFAEECAVDLPRSPWKVAMSPRAVVAGP